MISRSRLRRAVVVPPMTTRKMQTKDYEFVKGWNSNMSNDDMDLDQWRLVQDAREYQIGKWRTRYGNDPLSIPVGEAVNAQQTSTTGADTQTFDSMNWFAKKITATSSNPVTKLEANIRNPGGATGTVVLALFSDDSGTPGDELVRTTIASSEITSTLAYHGARSISCPDITNGTSYWVVGFVQAGGTGSYEISTTTNATTGLVSDDTGQSFTAANVDFNVKLSTATAGKVKGTIRVKRPGGAVYTFFAHGSNLYSVDETTGAVTSVDSGLSALSNYVRFAFVNDILYYVTGQQKPRKYDFASAAEVTTAPENASSIIVHKGLVFFLSASDLTKMYYTNFAAYETFTSTDFIYVDAPKKADPGVAFFILNGILYIQTRDNKYLLYGAQSATFRLDNAVGQKGTYSQESVVADEDRAFFANDEGIFEFNGAEEKNISEDILNRWVELLDKDNTVLELHDNRLYVWYTPNGEAINTRCFVYNVLYRIWESDDTLGYVSASSSGESNDDTFIQGSNRVGMVMYGERSSNDHNSMGQPLDTKLETSYGHYDTPAQFKRAPTYRPHFDTESGSYSVQVGYATDYSDDPTTSDISLAGSGVRFDTGVLFDSGAVFGGSQQINPLDSAPVIAGEWRRLQLRYGHYAAREPFSFDGHVLAIETQRLV